MTTNEPVSYDDLIAFACGELTGPRALRVERHLAQDAEAAATVERFQLARDHVKAAHFESPPAELIARAKQVFMSVEPTTPSAMRSLLDWVDAVVARLVYDSRLQPLAVRDISIGDEAQLTYEAGPWDIDLRAERRATGPSADRWEVMGQVDLEGDAGETLEVIVAVSGTERIVARAVVDDARMFSLELPHGRFDLAVRGTRGAVVLPELCLE